VTKPNLQKKKIVMQITSQTKCFKVYISGNNYNKEKVFTINIK